MRRAATTLTIVRLQTNYRQAISSAQPSDSSTRSCPHSDGLISQTPCGHHTGPACPVFLPRRHTTIQMLFESFKMRLRLS